MNKMAWKKEWQDEMPWCGEIWELENQAAWELDSLCSIEDIKAAYDMIWDKSSDVPHNAYRFFLPKSRDSVCNGGTRLALASYDVKVNTVWPVPKALEGMPIVDMTMADLF
jgi:hypothetical protein